MASTARGDPDSRARQWLLFLSLIFTGLFFFHSSLAWAQISFSSITGVVSEPTGAVGLNTSVVITDLNKGYAYRATTDATGRYLVVNLIPCTYEIKVQAQGFKTYFQPGIVVEVGTPVGIDVRLALGTATQTIEVTGAAPILSTQNAVTGQEINRNMIDDLPRPL